MNLDFVFMCALLHKYYQIGFISSNIIFDSINYIDFCLKFTKNGIAKKPSFLQITKAAYKINITHLNIV